MGSESHPFSRKVQDCVRSLGLPRWACFAWKSNSSFRRSLGEPIGAGEHTTIQKVSLEIRWNGGKRGQSNAVYRRPPRQTAPPSTGTPVRRTSSSFSGTTNSALPQSRQTEIVGNTQTTGLFKPASPGKWMAISPVKMLRFPDRQILQRGSFSG